MKRRIGLICGFILGLQAIAESEAYAWGNWGWNWHFPAISRQKLKTHNTHASFDPSRPASSALIESKVSFQDSKHATIHLADLSVPDALGHCPLESSPDGQDPLRLVVDQLVAKVHESVSKIKDTRGDGCSAIQNRLVNSQKLVGNALNYQFIAAGAIPNNANQDLINRQIQQASALNEFILTASDMLQNSCITNIDERVVIQRLIGQIVTLSGLFLGGWQGIAVAAGGQLVGNIPIFKTDLDAALTLFQKYQEVNARSSYLCLFRQLKKTGCLLFATKEDPFINGLDMSFKTGPVQTTLQSIHQYETENPTELEDIKMIRKITSASAAFVSLMEKPIDSLRSGVSREAFRELAEFCGGTPIHELKSIDLQESPLQESVRFLHSTCDQVTSLSWSAYRSAELFEPLDQIYWTLLKLNMAYQKLRHGEVSSSTGEKVISEGGKIANTWESLQYFESFKKSLYLYMDSPSANLTRLNFYHLTEELSNSLAARTFRDLFDQSYKTFRYGGESIFGFKFVSGWRSPVLDVRVRRIAMRSMIDLCQTVDPTLSCLYVGDPGKDFLFSLWRKKCVGPDSTLCRLITKRNEVDLILQDESYRSYFHSICGVKPQATAAPAASSVVP